MNVKQRLFCCSLWLISQYCTAEQATLAVAANFTAPMKAIVAQFEQNSPHKITLSFGSSGKFFAQIRHGAPYDILFSADQEKPAALIQARLAVPESRFTYALGKLLLWSADSTLLKTGNQALTEGKFQKLALANPRLAPYGQAAQEVLAALELNSKVSHKLVQGENIAQTFQFVRSGNAELGFIAVSQLALLSPQDQGSSWEIPSDLYSPIKQDAVLLQRGANNSAALAFLEFTKSSQALNIIESFGYMIP